MQVMLDCRAVTKRFGTTTALAGVDLTVESGEVRGLVGRNGAGKSTLLRCALGLIRPDTGELRLLERDVPPKAGRALDGVAGLVDGMRWPGGMTVQAALRMVADYDRSPHRVEEVIDRLTLGSQRRKRIASLSLGARQRLGVAAALLRSPRLLLLDEPVNGLDPAGRRDLRQLLRELSADGAAVVVSSHDLGEIAATCDTVTRLDAGRVSWTAPLAEVAHTADRRVTATTSDDQTALSVLGDVEGLQVSSSAEGGSLQLLGPADSLDEASLALGRAGIAIRVWEPESQLAAAMLGNPGDDDRPAIDAD